MFNCLFPTQSINILLNKNPPKQMAMHVVVSHIFGVPYMHNVDWINSTEHISLLTCHSLSLCPCDKHVPIVCMMYQLPVIAANLAKNPKSHTCTPGTITSLCEDTGPKLI